MTSTTATGSIEERAFVREWEEWHQALDASRRAPHSFLAMTSFNLLDETSRRFDAVPGTWSSTGQGVVVELADEESFIIADVAVTGRYDFGVIQERTYRRAYFGAALAELSKRGGRDILRPLYPDSPLRAEFRETPAFAPDPRWVIEGVFEPAPAPLAVDSAIPIIQHVYDSPGRVRFEFEGNPYTLVAIGEPGAGIASVLFRDETSGVTTYAASRTLRVALPAGGAGPVVVDFNRTQNLQCAYTDLAPCPLAPAGNRLPFAVEAGERFPERRRGDAGAP